VRRYLKTRRENTKVHCASERKKKLLSFIDGSCEPSDLMLKWAAMVQIFRRIGTQTALSQASKQSGEI
jgi:hypothetical protein